MHVLGADAHARARGELDDRAQRREGRADRRCRRPRRCPRPRAGTTAELRAPRRWSCSSSSSPRPAACRSAVIERLHAGQRLALEQLERRAAAGREVRDRVGQPEALAAPRRSRRRRPPSCRRSAASASATARVPAANGSSSNAPIGPFQNTVRAAAISLRVGLRACAGRCRAPSSRPGTSAPSTRARCASASKRSASTRSCGSSRRQRRLLGQLQRRAARARRPPPRPASRRSGAPCARKKLKHIAPPIRIASAISRKRSITPILSLTLAPPRTTTNGCSGSSSSERQHRHLALEQEAGDRRPQPVRDALGRRVRAVRGAEGVVHVHVAEPRQRVRQRGVVLGLARLEAAVLEHQHLARRRAAAPAARPRARRPRAPGAPAMPSQLRQPAPTRAPSRTADRGPSGRSEVRDEHEPRILARAGTRSSAARPGCGRRPPPARLVALALERDVEVDAHERAAARRHRRRGRSSSETRARRRSRLRRAPAARRGPSPPAPPSRHE